MSPAPSTAARRRLRVDLPLALILAAVPLACAAAITSGAIQDYVVHLELWQWVLAAQDPYLPSVHAYGPVFNAIALLAWLHPLAPKLAFVAVWLAMAGWLVVLARDASSPGSRLPLGIALFLLNPWFWSEVALYGHFDVLVAAACVLAVHAAHTHRTNLAAVWLSLGVLLKFLPLVLLPSVAFDVPNRALRLRAIGIVLGLCIAAFLVSFAIYGASVFEPFRFGGTRASSGFSIFEYLRGPYSFLGLAGPPPNLDAWSTPLLLCGLSVTALFTLARRCDPATSALLLMLVLLTLYRAGHSQFQMIPALLAPYWLIRHAESAGTWVRSAFAIYFAWLGLETVAWLSGPWPRFLGFDGLVHFAFATNLFLALAQHAGRKGEAPELRSIRFAP